MLFRNKHADIDKYFMQLVNYYIFFLNWFPVSIQK